ncbi:MAG: PorT family protein [Prevotellaceae bacterium]|jgi:hypothetical protein|nr:PorT family protein [Prevotellaceae bacterium]
MSKRAYILLLVCLLCGLKVHAQEKYLGVRYGAGISMIYFTPNVEQQSVVMPYNFGLAYKQFAEKYVGLEVELNYGTRGYKYGLDTASKHTVESQVVELPGIMQIRFPVTKNFKIYVNGIAYVAYYLKNTETYDNNGVTVKQTFDYGNFDNFDFGVGGGLGLGYSFGKTDVTLDARFTTGVAELYKQTVDRYESLPQQIIVSVSVLRRIGRTK